MHRWIVLPLLLTAALAPGAENAFNGRDLTGWTAINGAQPGNKQRKTADIWKVRDGALICVGTPGSWSLLQTARDYKDFRLTLDYRWGTIDPAVRAEGDNIYNGGIYFRANPRPAGAAPARLPIPMAYQAQLIHSPGRTSGDAGGGTGDMWIIGYDHPGFSGPRPLPTNYVAQALGPRGEAAQREAPQPGMAKARGFSRSRFAEKPLGEWNRYEIVASGGTLTYTLNGERINEGSGAVALPGKIGLECENTPIFFRNIRVTPL